ncbi:MAG: hypothetical protein NTY48_02305 [Candidatus Diapherotrites archaeon]|nr:hypothetical protein [Candidatus Diapherotrites archaeon]
MKIISVANALYPIYQVDENLFTGSSNYASLLELKKRGVSVILSVYPKNTLQSIALRSFQRKHKVKILFSSDRISSDFILRDKLAAQVLKFAKNHKVAVVCSTGDFSRKFVAEQYLKLKRDALLSSRRKVLEIAKRRLSQRRRAGLKRKRK